MGFLDELQSTLGSVLNNASSSQSGVSRQNNQSRQASGGGLSDILGPGLLGGLIGAFLPGKGGMLKTGGATALAAMLWNKYKDQILPPASPSNTSAPAALTAPAQPLAASDGTTLDNPTSRIIRAMVYAAKSDGHIDDNEQAAISQRLRQLEAGPAASQLLAQAMNEPLDPAKVAAGVIDPQEAMALFLASCSVVRLDNFMENAYLDGLAKALGLPEEMKKEIQEEAQKA